MTTNGIRGSSDRSILVLTSLAGGPKHGYSLIKDIEEFAAVTLGPGTLYGCLSKLEQAGLVEPLPAEERRHPYRITAAGLAVVTWGDIQFMSEAFLVTFCDEAVAYVSQECLVNQKSPEGFDYAALLADLRELA